MQLLMIAKQHKPCDDIRRHDVKVPEELVEKSCYLSERILYRRHKSSRCLLLF